MAYNKGLDELGEAPLDHSSRSNPKFCQTKEEYMAICRNAKRLDHERDLKNGLVKKLDNPNTNVNGFKKLHESVDRLKGKMVTVNNSIQKVLEDKNEEKDLELIKRISDEIRKDNSLD